MFFCMPVNSSLFSACAWWFFAAFCIVVLVGRWSLAPPLEHRLCFDFVTGDSRRGGGAARVSGLVELLSLLLGCLALLGYTSSPRCLAGGTWSGSFRCPPLNVWRETVGFFGRPSGASGDSDQPSPPY